MEFVTTSQINDFNNPLAFSRSRANRVGQTALGSPTSRSVRTDDIEASFRLVLGAASRLETLEGNLQTMLDLTEQGFRARGDERKVREAYGKIRSLSAGFDQVVEAIRFNGEPVFTGKPVSLNMGPGTQDLQLDSAKLLTYGEDSLNLSEGIESADIRIGYTTTDRILNDAFDIIGLDLNEASYISGSNPALELEDGEYKVEIEYAGADSKVAIRTTEGTLIEEQTEVDLSGNGTEWVDFDAGVRLSFEKESLFQSFDKFDFETNGPAKLQASMTYDRIERHVVRTEEGDATGEKVEFLFDSTLSLGGGSLSLSEARISAVDQDKIALESGNYNIEVEYRGADSIVKLTDGLGRIKSYEFGVDLSAQGNQQVDLGNGLSFTVNNDSFDTIGAKYIAAINYQVEEQAIDQFDFLDYKERVEDAIAIVREQSQMIADAQAQIEQVNQLRNSALTSAAPNVGALSASGATSLLSGGSGVGIFASTSPDARFGILSEQLFNTTNAFPAQANQSPEALAQLSLGGGAGSLLSTFV